MGVINTFSSPWLNYVQYGQVISLWGYIKSPSWVHIILSLSLPFFLYVCVGVYIQKQETLKLFYFRSGYGKLTIMFFEYLLVAFVKKFSIECL